MKSITKKITLLLVVAGISLALFSFSCSSKPTSAATAFADTSSPVSIPKESLAVVEALQSAFRSVSNGVLPSVVELDTIEKKMVKSTNPFEGFPFFFFGQPEGSQQGEEREYKQEGLGSGVIVRRNKNTLYVLTNNHVVGKATEISVKLYDGRVFTGKLVGADERKDIALVSFETEDTSIPVAVLGNSDTVQTGDIILAMGTPLGYFSSVTQGIVSATGRTGSGIGNISDFIQTDAAINQGNSGGPLVNIYGEVIGINTWIASQSGGSQGLGFSIPINNVKKAIDDFISSGKVTYGWMGVSLMEIDKDYQKSLGVEGKTGALASQVFIDSPAYKGGMQSGDFVTSLNGKAVKNVDQLMREVGDLAVGQVADFTVIRGGKEKTLKVKIEERKAATVSDNSKLWPGFIAYPLTDDARKQLKVDDKIQGVLITNVQAKTAAAVMGLQTGDIITAVNDSDVRTLAEFFAAMDTSGKKEVWFTIYREGHKISTVKYKL